MISASRMAHGDAASNDGTGSEAEELHSDEVAAAAHTTHRRPKQATGMPDDVDFDIPLALGAPSALLLEPPPDPVVEPPPQSAPASDPYLSKIGRASCRESLYESGEAAR